VREGPASVRVGPADDDIAVSRLTKEHQQRPLGRLVRVVAHCPEPEFEKCGRGTGGRDMGKGPASVRVGPADDDIAVSRLTKEHQLRGSHSLPDWPNSDGSWTLSHRTAPSTVLPTLVGPANSKDPSV
jgi:hypothetical protein